MVRQFLGGLGQLFYHGPDDDDPVDHTQEGLESDIERRIHEMESGMRGGVEEENNMYVGEERDLSDMYVGPGVVDEDEIPSDEVFGAVLDPHGTNLADMRDALVASLGEEGYARLERAAESGRQNLGSTVDVFLSVYETADDEPSEDQE